MRTVIGIIGEDPYDTEAIANLLASRYSLRFKPILKNIKGTQLTSPKTRRLLKIELQSNRYPIIIYCKDLDGLESEKNKIEDANAWFRKLDNVNRNQGILLLNIYELEALILADIETFNRLFKVEVKFPGNPMSLESPKEFLMRKTRHSRRKFGVSENRAVFKELRIEKVMERCKYFREFIKVLDRMSNCKDTVRQR